MACIYTYIYMHIYVYIYIYVYIHLYRFSNGPPAFPDNISPTSSYHGLGTISAERSANSLAGKHTANGSKHWRRAEPKRLVRKVA